LKKYVRGCESLKKYIRGCMSFEEIEISMQNFRGDCEGKYVDLYIHSLTQKFENVLFKSYFERGYCMMC
jgi:hypothetical protein